MEITELHLKRVRAKLFDKYQIRIDALFYKLSNTSVHRLEESYRSQRERGEGQG